MNDLVHWFAINANVLAAVVTIGVVALFACCLECSDCSRHDKDDLFCHHIV
jgi:hypothetical protein